MIRPPLLLLLLLCHGACFAPVGNGEQPSTTDPTGDTGDTGTGTHTTVTSGAVATSVADSTGDPTTELAPTSTGSDARPRNCTWTQIGFEGPPKPRYGHSIDLDLEGALLMFAGRSGAEGPNYDDVWQYDGMWHNVTPMAPANGPSARRGFAAAVHPDLGLVVFGGDDDDNNGGAGFPSETWVLNGSNWTQLATDPALIGRAHATMEYQPEPTPRLILFGGHDVNGQLPDGTWALSAKGVWSRLPVLQPPPVRTNHTMALEAGGSLLLHGGCGKNVMCTAILDDTWRWDGEAWHLVSQGGKATRYGGVMTRATADGTLFRFIGGTTQLESYQWLDDEWVPLQGVSVQPPTTMEEFQAEYHPNAGEGEVILFGGKRAEGTNDETWRFRCEP